MGEKMWMMILQKADPSTSLAGLCITIRAEKALPFFAGEDYARNETAGLQTKYSKYYL